MTDRACEEGVESGAQPEEQPNRLAMTMGSKRLNVKPMRLRGRNGKVEERETDQITQ